MAETLTIDPIKRQFDAEWILVEDPVTDESLEVLAGTVVCHSKNRDEVYQSAVDRRPARFAVLYTGEMPANTAIVL